MVGGSYNHEVPGRTSSGNSRRANGLESRRFREFQPFHRLLDQPEHYQQPRHAKIFAKPQAHMVNDSINNPISASSTDWRSRSDSEVLKKDSFATARARDSRIRHTTNKPISVAKPSGEGRNFHVKSEALKFAENISFDCELKISTTMRLFNCSRREAILECAESYSWSDEYVSYFMDRQPDHSDDLPADPAFSDEEYDEYSDFDFEMELSVQEEILYATHTIENFPAEEAVTLHIEEPTVAIATVTTQPLLLAADCQLTPFHICPPLIEYTRDSICGLIVSLLYILFCYRHTMKLPSTDAFLSRMPKLAGRTYSCTYKVP